MDLFRRAFDDPLALIFTVISLVYFVRGLRLAWTGWQRRDALGGEPLTPWKRSWAEQAAFYVAVPPGVLIHELGHAVAVWLFGGRVEEFGFGFFWGYVLPSGAFTESERWIISVAGTAGTLLYAFLFWFVARRSDATPWRYFGLRTLRFHLYYALIYYPLFTLFTFIGDWRTIYNFEATPILSGAMLVTHLSVLAFFWWSDRQSWYEMPAFESEEQERALSTLRQEAEARPMDEQIQLQLVDALRRHGARREARERLRTFLEQNPGSAQAHLLLAAELARGTGQLPASAREHAEKALSLGLAEPRQRAYASALLGEHALKVERLDDAKRHLDEAIAASERTQGPRLADPASLFYLRAQVHRRLGQYQAAYQDIERALERVQGEGQEQRRAAFENERRNIIHQSGGKLPADLRSGE